MSTSALDLPGVESICLTRRDEGNINCINCPVLRKTKKAETFIVVSDNDRDRDDGGIALRTVQRTTKHEPSSGPWTPFLEVILYHARRDEPFPEGYLESLCLRCPQAHANLDRAIEMAKAIPVSRAAYHVIDLMPAFTSRSDSGNTTVLCKMEVAVPLDESGLQYFMGEQTP